MMYGEQNSRFQDKLWNETLEELSFAKVHEILDKKD